MVITNMKRIIALILLISSTPLLAQWLSRGVSVRKIMAPPKLAVSDNFNRANGALGANWSTVTSMSAGLIQSNGATGAAYPAVSGNYWSANTFSNDQYAELYLNNWSSGAFNYGSGSVAVRISNSQKTFYSFGKYPAYSGMWSACKYINGVEQWCTANFVATAPAGNTATIRLEVIGDTLSLYKLTSHGVGKTLVLQIVDPTPLSGGYPGYLAQTRNPSNVLIDNFYAGDL